MHIHHEEILGFEHALLFMHSDNTIGAALNFLLFPYFAMTLTGGERQENKDQEY